LSEFLNKTIDGLRKGPLGPLVRWSEAHPRLAAWIVLALGMVILLVIEARDVGLLPHQWAALIVATVLVAGACVWIISWEDEDEMATQANAMGVQTSEATATSDAGADAGADAETSGAVTPPHGTKKR
jgi:hypothetical protein